MRILGRTRALHLPELNITSMVDMMAVLTMYLLATFATADLGVRPLSDIALPASHTLRAEPVAALKVSMSQSTMRLDNEVVASLRAGQVNADDIDNEQRILPLLHALQRTRARAASQVRLQNDADAAQRDLLAIEASHGLPYIAVDRVVRTARAAGFTRFRLAVARKE